MQEKIFDLVILCSSLSDEEKRISREWIKDTIPTIDLTQFTWARELIDEVQRTLAAHQPLGSGNRGNLAAS
jgi:hypothetical protein